jgi:hypothetical protein
MSEDFLRRTSKEKALGPFDSSNAAHHNLNVRLFAEWGRPCMTSLSDSCFLIFTRLTDRGEKILKTVWLLKDRIHS